MIRASIILNGHTSLPVFGKGSMTGESCRDIFVHYVHIFSDSVDPDFILMAYNAHPVRTHLVDEEKVN